MISPRALPKDENGFTLVELLIVTLIMGVIMGALVMVLGVGEQATGIGSAKVDLQSDTKTLVDWIVRDVRQAKIQELYNNTPTTDYIKFNLWEWDNTTFRQEKTDYYVEYEFDPGNQTLYRRYINDTMPDDCIAEDEDDETCKIRNQWNFTDVLMSPFYTDYINETSNGFNSTVLLNNRRIIVAIKKGKTVRNRPLNFIMVEEIKIRNE